MNVCVVKRGIFSLRECGNEASDICTGCKSPICQEHAVYSSSMVYCAICEAKIRAGQALPSATDPKLAGGTGVPGAAPTKPVTPVVDPNKPVSTTPPPAPEDWESPGWSQRWRYHYYETYSYHPFYYNSWSVGYYDDYDRNSFDVRADGSFDGDGAEAGGFSDS